MGSTELRVAAKQALEALEAGPDVDPIFAGETEDALRAALVEDALQKFTEVSQEIEAALAEPQRMLTDEVIADLWHQNGGFHHHFARAIERWLRGHA